jgi:hypothetical protein
MLKSVLSFLRGVFTRKRLPIRVPETVKLRPQIEGISEADLAHIMTAFAMNRAGASLALRISGPDVAFDYVLQQLRDTEYQLVFPDMDREQFHQEYRKRSVPNTFATGLWRVCCLLEESLDEHGALITGTVNDCRIVACDGQVANIKRRKLDYAA